jgi:hypothetical protein
MHNKLLQISLATMLNGPAHVAMSYPFYRAPKVLDSGFPNPEQDPTCYRIKDLFNQYERGSAGSRKDLRRDSSWIGRALRLNYSWRGQSNAGRWVKVGRVDY